MQDQCTVDEAIERSEWRWPYEWNDKYPALKQYGTPNLNLSTKDVTKWKDRSGKIADFSVRRAWKDTYAEGMKVNWCSWVWFAQCIPKHSFALWMAVQGRLLTQDRISKWNPNQILLCSLCEECNDSHEHLFFKCKFSEKIWNNLQAKLCRKYSTKWQDLIEELSHSMVSRNIWCIVSKLVCGAAVYYIWNERNQRLFGGKKRNVGALSNEIEDTIRFSLMNLKVKETVAVRHVEEKWNIKIPRYRNKVV